MPHDTVTVLLIADNRGDARRIGEAFRDLDSDFVLEHVGRLTEGLQRLRRGGIDAVVLDLSLPDAHGLQSVESVLDEAPSVPIIVLSELNDEETAEGAVRAGAQDYLVKGHVDAASIRRSLRYAIGRRRFEVTLRANETRHRALLEAIPDTMFRVHRSGQFLDFRPSRDGSIPASGEELAQWSLDTTFPEEVAEQYRAHLDRTLETGETQLFEYSLKKDLQTSHYESRIVGSGQDEALAIVRDVTEAKRLSEQLRLSQRLESVGRLAGGIAHDFNNLLTVISGNAELALMDMSGKDPNREALEEIAGAAERAATLTRQLLAFSRKQVLKPVTLDLNALLRGTLKILGRLIGEDIELAVKLAPELDNFEADPTQMEQVLVNLAVNARDAMPEGGTLLFETDNVDVYETYWGQHFEVRSGPYVMLAVSDTGVGMDEETKGRIFEPFFTTKERGKGTGLGLATVYGIVKQSGGYVWVYSEPGMGTTFKIYFPRVAPGSAVAPDADEESVEPGRGETILLVEDDETVLGVARRFLSEGGYRVISATDIENALKIVVNHEGTIHLLATDVVMPGSSGRDLANRVRGIRPEMKILYMSGYTDNAIAQHGVLEPGVAFLEKPYSRANLLRAVRRELDAPED